ncbi:sirohydrochlorin chelatase [Litoribrevibacter albus]|uniref:Cobalamin (Vitamin B12) biosynthesis CbiX protein n=1 Tax=Litoribrevibacter albus TaxID=1473156 RepID=A0AA37W6E4_9GAMM|nr:CbiX/SirB N-terminal domain-containing protein [Litoribrevibacter albus]GLQ29789.1 cobalamin (vitamin B12) biosynthesis CbiX protein [Litoribrevibacter albus]
MRVLLVLAHGSRVVKSNEEVVALATELSEKMPEYDRVEPCFLELTEPRFSRVLADVATESVTEIVVYPHFLAEGRHVRDDVPDIIRQFESTHPGVKVVLKPYLGMWQGLSDFIAAGLIGKSENIERTILD